MLGVFIALLIGLNLIATAIVLSACVVSGRAERCHDEQEALVMHQKQVNAALDRLRTVEPQSVPSQL